MHTENYTPMPGPPAGPGAVRGTWGRPRGLGGGDGVGESPGPPAGLPVGPGAVRGALGGGMGLGRVSAGSMGSMVMCTDRDKGISTCVSSRCGPNRNDMP